MTDATEQPQPSTAPVSKRWHITLTDKTIRTVEARGFRVEHGALVLVQPLGCAAAYAPSTWLTIEEADPGRWWSADMDAARPPARGARPSRVGATLARGGCPQRVTRTAWLR